MKVLDKEAKIDVSQLWEDISDVALDGLFVKSDKVWQ